MQSLKPKRGVGLNLRLEFIDEILEQLPKVDFFEVIADNWLSDGPHHQKLMKLRENYQLSFHCVGMNLGGIDPLNFNYLSSIEALVNQFEPFQISDHLCLQAHEGVYHHDLLPIAYNQRTLLQVSERVHLIQDQLKQELLVENLSSYIRFSESTMSEFDFIIQLMRETGCFLLLDLNNLWVNEQNMKDIDFNEELSKIDWNRVKEVHLAAPERMDNFWVDTHGAAIKEELKTIMNRHKRHLSDLPVIFEQDSNLPPLASLLNEVQGIKELIDE